MSNMPEYTNKRGKLTRNKTENCPTYDKYTELQYTVPTFSCT